MTKKEALRRVKSYLTDYIPADNYEEVEEIVEALEQEPCNDAVSRQAVLEVIRKCHCEEWVKANIGAPIEVLSPVAPQPKTGHWRPIYQGDEIIDYRCSKCEFGNTFGKSTHGMNYCPHCGAKMEVEE